MSHTSWFILKVTLQVLASKHQFWNSRASVLASYLFTSLLIPWSFISVISARFIKQTGAFLEATFQVKFKSCLKKNKEEMYE